MPGILRRLAKTIDKRKADKSSQSYAAKLFARGPEKCAEKFGEEAVEAIIAAARGDKKNLTEEAADVLFHLLVMLSACDVDWDDVLRELERREGTSGIVEKESRGK
ncbi:phosphoribosyl-ATP diphosphatase [Abyssibius alkaniclasticus]|uniref:phosphoribosyl-ATP diphosphatase n=1 Tax=Abyssibius alkaniclasticus TaxID=2881234 RepID=UPI0040582FD1|tara:strand:- start:647 stop:964 length:318 start_codon:yes stop_codon:yes gene_type:complete